LRQILLDAKAGDTITFDPVAFPPARPITISLLSELPQVTQGQLTIDASNAGVILDGSNTPPGTTGLRLVSDGNAVQGLQILYFPTNGITIGNASHNRIGGDRTKGKGPLGEGNLLSGNVGCGVHIGGRDAETTGNTVSGNLIGTDLSGTAIIRNWRGVYLAGWASYNVIGGATAGERNIISGNDIGVEIFQTGVNGNVVAGNYIGTDISGRLPLGNREYGVAIWDGPCGNIVGGMGPGEGNLISGNPTGVMVAGSNANQNAVIGNRIGTDASGTSALGNQTGISLYTGTFSRIERNLISGNLGTGIVLGDQNSLILGNLIGTDIGGTQALGNGLGICLGGQHILVGGSAPLERNIVADNHVGIDASLAGTEYNWIAGNAIGTDATGTIPLGNLQMGVRMRVYAAHNFIQGNTIAFNRGEWGNVGGVYVEHSLYNPIRRNSIYGNIGVGIVLDQDGNQMLPAPVIAAATPTSVYGTACAGCMVEVFSDAEDEGRIYEGSTMADDSGAFVFDRGSPLAGPHVTATATDGEGNTSEFSAPYTIAVPPSTVALSGPASGITGASYTFSASVTPSSASTPITYVWEATGQTPVTHTAGLSDTVAFTWTSPGAKTIIVTATNAGGTVTNAHLITISPSFAPPARWIANYGASAGGWTSQDKYPRHVADVNGDGRGDVVGFGNAGVYVSLSTGSKFGTPTRWIANYGYSAGGWTSQNTYPRMLGDVNKDGKADVVGFGKYGTYVSLSTGTSFAPATRWIANYGTVVGEWTSQDKYPRALADVNKDGRADVVGFGNAGVFVSLATSGNTFAPPALWIRAFGAAAGGWTSQTLFPRLVADVDGDGRADIVGFSKYGAYVSLSTGTSFLPATRWIANYGTVVGGWTSQNLLPRLLADVNGDGKADIVGFASTMAVVSLSTGTAFGLPVLGIAGFGTGYGWSSQDASPRALGDVNHDHKADIVGFGGSGTYISLYQ
jgi:hypothetical protein